MYLDTYTDLTFFLFLSEVYDLFQLLCVLSSVFYFEVFVFLLKQSSASELLEPVL